MLPQLSRLEAAIIIYGITALIICIVVLSTKLRLLSLHHRDYKLRAMAMIAQYQEVLSVQADNVEKLMTELSLKPKKPSVPLGNIIKCKRCGTDIVRSARAKRYCSECARLNHNDIALKVYYKKREGANNDPQEQIKT